MLLTDRKSSEVAERLQKAVEEALAARNLSARRASMDVVGHDGLIRDIRAGRIPSVDRVEALFDYLGLEFYFGPRRTSQAGSGPSAVINIGSDDDAPAGFLTIPWAEPSLRQGSAPVAFSRAWLSEHSLVPDFLVVAAPETVPELGVSWEDHLALLDTRASLRRGHDLWCYRADGHLQVSYITFKGNITVVHPSGPSAAPRIIEGPPGQVINILGKVVWLGESVPFKGKVT